MSRQPCQRVSMPRYDSSCVSHALSSTQLPYRPSAYMTIFLRHQVSLTLGIFVSLALVWIVAIPPFQMPDEPAHYIKSCANPLVDKQNGHYGHFYDSSLQEIASHSPPGGKGKFDIEKFFSAPIQEAGKHEFFPDALPNTVVVYAAPTLVCHVMTALNISRQHIFYAMRMATLGTFIVLLIVALRTHRELFLAMSPMLMIPMVINQSIAIGADSFSIATCMLAATVLVAGVRDRNVNPGLTALTLFLLLNTKTAYLVFALPLAWMLIKNGIFSKAGSLVLHTMAGATALALQLFFLARKTNAESTSQFAAIKTEQLINDPMHFVMLLDASVARKYWIYVQTTIGKVGWLDTPVSWFGFYAFICSAVVTLFVLAAPTAWNRVVPMLLGMATTGAAVYASINYRLRGILVSATGYLAFMVLTRKRHGQLTLRLILLTAILVACLLVFLSMHIFWGPAGMRYIEGVQGRYFLPVIPFLIALLYLQHQELPDWKTYALGAIFLFNLGVTLHYLIATVIPRFYG